MATATHTIDEAIEFFEGLNARMIAGAEVGLDDGLQEILHEAKREIGTYQRSDLPSENDAWPELSGWTKGDRKAQGYSPNDPGLRNGKMRDSYGAQREGLKGEVGSDDENAVAFELGRDTRGSVQPPRPVLLVAAFRKADAAFAAIARRVFAKIMEP